MNKDLKTLDQSCPAFSEGCPYAHPHSEDDAKARTESTDKCPAFADGCPFKDAKSATSLSEMLKKVPDSHKAGGKILGSISALHAIMSSIHEKSKSTKQEIGSECPVFSSQGCPFKNLTSSGTPLVAELEYRTWSVFNIEDNDNDDDEEEEKQINDILLSKNLKDGTRKSHRAAENVQFVKNFIKGKINRDAYKQMIVSLWHVYVALEDELRKNATHPTFGALHFPIQLEREKELVLDLNYFYGNDSWRSIAPSTCTASYVQRIRQVGKESPELLVAHAYTRYLGDLSGGRVLMRVAKKAMKLPKNGDGTKFYAFANIASGRTFKKMYRATLDQTLVTAPVADQIVAEANVAFVMNMRCFEELDVMSGDAVSVRSLEEVMLTLKMPVKKEQKCPFAVLGGPNPHAVGGSMPFVPKKETTTASKVDVTAMKGECPWPFVLLHDPVVGMKNPLTYVLLVVLFAVFYRQILSLVGL